MVLETGQSVNGLGFIGTANKSLIADASTAFSSNFQATVKDTNNNGFYDIDDYDAVEPVSNSAVSESVSQAYDNGARFFGFGEQHNKVPIEEIRTTINTLHTEKNQQNFIIFNELYPELQKHLDLFMEGKINRKALLNQMLLSYGPDEVLEFYGNLSNKKLLKLYKTDSRWGSILHRLELKTEKFQMLRDQAEDLGINIKAIAIDDRPKTDIPLENQHMDNRDIDMANRMIESLSKYGKEPNTIFMMSAGALHTATNSIESPSLPNSLLNNYTEEYEQSLSLGNPKNLITPDQYAAKYKLRLNHGVNGDLANPALKQVSEWLSSKQIDADRYIHSMKFTVAALAPHPDKLDDGFAAPIDAYDAAFRLIDTRSDHVVDTNKNNILDRGDFAGTQTLRNTTLASNIENAQSNGARLLAISRGKSVIQKQLPIEIYQTIISTLYTNGENNITFLDDVDMALQQPIDEYFADTINEEALLAAMILSDPSIAFLKPNEIQRYDNANTSKIFTWAKEISWYNTEHLEKKIAMYNMLKEATAKNKLNLKVQTIGTTGSPDRHNNQNINQNSIRANKILESLNNNSNGTIIINADDLHTEESSPIPSTKSNTRSSNTILGQIHQWLADNKSDPDQYFFNMLFTNEFDVSASESSTEKAAIRFNDFDKIYKTTFSD